MVGQKLKLDSLGRAYWNVKTMVLTPFLDFGLDPI